MTETESSRTLERMLNILECVVAAKRPVPLVFVTKMTSLPKPTVHRLLMKMTSSGLITSLGENSYTAGRRLVNLLHLAQGNNEIKRISNVLIKNMANTLVEACYLATLEGTSVKILVADSPEDSYMHYILPGATLPFHAAAAGKAIAAYQNPDLLINTKKEIVRYTDKTITDINAILNEFEIIKKQGYAVCKNEINNGISAIAVPLFLSNDKVFYSIGCVGPTDRIIKEKKSNIIIELHHKSKIIQSSLNIIS